MNKEEIEEGIKVFIEKLKESRRKVKFKTHTAYFRKMDGRFLGASDKERFILGTVILTEDPESIRLLDPVIKKIAIKREIKFEDLGDIEI